jgi:hypothetical protein
MAAINRRHWWGPLLSLMAAINGRHWWRPLLSLMTAINGRHWWRPLLSVSLSLRMYIYEEGRLILITTIVRENTLHSQTRSVLPIPVPPSASTDSVGEQASEIAVHRETLARVCGRSSFWGAYSRLLASSAHPALIKFLVTGAVRGTALRTSACIDCLWLHRTYIRDVSCEWSHWYLEHWSLHRVQSVLCICAYFIVVYCLC